MLFLSVPTDRHVHPIFHLHRFRQFLYQLHSLDADRDHLAHEAHDVLFVVAAVGIAHNAAAFIRAGLVLIDHPFESRAVAQEWAEAERMIGAIEDSTSRARALRALGAALMNAKNYLQLLRLVQRSWQQANTRDYAVTLLSLVNGIVPLKEIGLALLESFSWVDDFLKG